LPENTDFFMTAKIHALKALTEPNSALAQKYALAAEALGTIAVAEELRTANLLCYYRIVSDHPEYQFSDLDDIKVRIGIV
jgi:hypothetical protein